MTLWILILFRMGISHNDTMLFCNDNDTVSDALADPRGASLAPLAVQFIFNFLQFSRKDGQNDRLAHTLPHWVWEILDPRLDGISHTDTMLFCNDLNRVRNDIHNGKMNSFHTLISWVLFIVCVIVRK